MNPHILFHAACFVIVLLGGASLFVAPFTARGRAAAHWMRVALWLASPIAIAWALMGLTLLFGSEHLSPHAARVLRETKSLLSGMDIGILVLLFASGEFIPAFARPKVAPEPNER